VSSVTDGGADRYAAEREAAFADPAERVLGRILWYHARQRPDRPFVRSDAGDWTYAEVDVLADRYAAGLSRLGVRAGDTVALLTRAAPELVPLTFGINRLGAVWVPTNPEYAGEWLAQSLADSRAAVLVVDADLLPEVGSVAAATIDAGGPHFDHVVVLGEPQGAGPGGATVHTLDEVSAPGGAYPPADVAFGDTAAVLWTSGTTGRAKGVMQSHNAFVRAALTGARSSATTPDDVLYCCLPLHNSAAWVGVIYRALVSGASFALDPGFSVHDFWDRIRHYGATQAFTLGAMHLFLWQAPERDDDLDNSLRSMGAIPMPDALIEPFKRRFGIERVQQGYGQSEIMGLLSRIDDGHTTYSPGSVGQPLPGIEVRLLDDDDCQVATGEVGEFCVRPTEPNVLFNGYFCDPEATLQSWRNLWYHTGDLGRKDAEGQYFFVDRKRDLVRFMGRSISSAVVEAAVSEHPAVAQVAAFGVAVEGLESESELMVTVVLKDGATATEEELASFVGAHSPEFMVPRFVELVDALPRTPTGKVQKYTLRERGRTAATWERPRAAVGPRHVGGAVDSGATSNSQEARS
jgi:crotonobetaine/carnitine-CoA ligase